jgi:hypothetical protein
VRRPYLSWPLGADERRRNATDTWVIVLLVLLALVAVTTLVVAIFLTARLVKSFRLLRSEEIPLANKAAFWVALVYTICPVDLLPDPIYLDDIGVLLAAIHYLDGAVRKLDARRDGSLSLP